MHFCSSVCILLLSWFACFAFCLVFAWFCCLLICFCSCLSCRSQNSSFVCCFFVAVTIYCLFVRVLLACFLFAYCICFLFLFVFLVWCLFVFVFYFIHFSFISHTQGIGAANNTCLLVLVIPVFVLIVITIFGICTACTGRDRWCSCCLRSLFEWLLWLIISLFLLSLFVLFVLISPFVCFLRFNVLTVRRLFYCSFTVCLLFTYRMWCLFAVCLFSGFLFLFLHLLFVLLIWHSCWRCSCMMVMVLLVFVLNVFGPVLLFIRGHSCCCSRDLLLVFILFDVWCLYSCWPYLLFFACWRPCVLTHICAHCVIVVTRAVSVRGHIGLALLVLFVFALVVY